MELATINLRLQGQTQNTVIKRDVTPAQLAIYAYMHGEDCVQSLNVTSIDDKRTTYEEMNRLRGIFVSDHSSKTLNTIFPGIHPQLPTTFRAIGFDPEMLHDHNLTPAPAAQPKSERKAPVVSQSAIGAAVIEKIRQGASERSLEQGNVPPVRPQELAGALDNTGGDFDEDDNEPDDEHEFSDDPIDLEIAREQQLKLPPKSA